MNRWIAKGTLALLLVTTAAPATRATAPPSPPPGWEQPPPLPAPKPKPSKPSKLDQPACCAYDDTCCSRQMIIDAPTGGHIARVVEVHAAALPEEVVKEASKDHPEIEGAPPLRVIDGKGRPPPWSDGPKQEIRAVPPGRFGEITWGEYTVPHFADPAYRSMGYGAVHNIHDGKTQIPSNLSYTSIAQGEGDKVVIDTVSGTLDGIDRKPVLHVTKWSHVEAANITDGIIHGYRGGREGEDRIFFLMPEVILGFESKDTKSDGGFLPSRFSRSVSYTIYAVPVGPGRSGLATFSMDNGQYARWFRRPAGSAKLPANISAMISSSQTSAEAEPRVRVIFF